MCVFQFLLQSLSHPSRVGRGRSVHVAVHVEDPLLSGRVVAGVSSGGIVAG